ncbi:protein DMP7 [Vitis riparia]|uniref:protein DMP7 n=1 Tax=Vitis riparia TaxID=96939 RepID=UPI00155A41C6|nr:protein DMP7 [Vitis riparia]
MEVKVQTDEEVQRVIEQQLQPLLEHSPIPEKLMKTPLQRFIRKTFKGTAHLSNLLPTGTVLGFQMFSPILSNKGHCLTSATHSLTLGLLAACCASCFILSFTDSFRDAKGKVRYGLATSRGLWVIDGSVTLAPDVAAGYRLKFIDFVHAFMSIVVFAAVALFDQNIVKCFCPMPSEETKKLLVAVPLWTGVVCCLFFVVFPSKRHGIGFPLSRG